MNTQKLIHLWANDADLSLDKRAGNVSCRDGKLYSYSTVIAVRVSDGKGGFRTFISMRNYSVTTSKHQTYVNRSVWGETYFLPTVNDFANLTLSTKDFYAEAVKEALHGFRVDTAALTAKTKDGTSKMRYLCHLLNHYCKVVHAFGTAAQKKLVPSRTQECTVAELMKFRDLIDKKKSASEVASAVEFAKGVITGTPTVDRATTCVEQMRQAITINRNIGGKGEKGLLKLLAEVEAKRKEAVAHAKREQAEYEAGVLLRRCKEHYDNLPRWKQHRTDHDFSDVLLFHTLSTLISNLGKLQTRYAEIVTDEQIEEVRVNVETALTLPRVTTLLKTTLDKEGEFTAEIGNHTSLPVLPITVREFSSLATLLAGYDKERFSEVAASAEAMKLRLEAVVETATAIYRKAIAVRHEADRDAWLAGTTNSLNWASYIPEPILLRVNGQEIETSRHARVPVSVAKGVWELIQSVMRKGEALTHDFGECASLGSFRLREIRPDGSMQVGCHNLPYSSIEYVAKQLGFIKSAGVSLSKLVY